MVFKFCRKIKEKISKKELFRHINKDFFPYLLQFPDTPVHL